MSFTKKFTDFTRKHIAEIISGLISGMIFLWLYSPKVLDPSNVDFLLVGGDLSQHYLGWELYRNGAFRWIFGLTDMAAYPYSTSVIFTDSIPICAVIFKHLFFFVKRPFQYFGLWGLLCFVLQGFLAARLVKRRLILEGYWLDAASVVLSLLFVFCPFFIRRMFWHCALAGQFVILIAIDLFDNTLKYSRARMTIYWIGMGLLCASIHLYFLAMCGMILAGSCLYLFLDRKNNKKSGGWQLVLDIFCPLAGFIFFAWYMIFALGGFSSRMDGGAPGLGYYSFNLNGLVNADDGYSRILPQLSYCEDGQYEGNAYLGFGVLLFICAVLVLWICKSIRSRAKDAAKGSAVTADKNYRISAFVVFLIVVIVSASNKITIGSHVLCEIPLPSFIEKLYSPFRSSGRLIWPACYMLMLSMISGLSAVISALSYKKKNYAALALSAVFLLLQIYDLSGKLESIHSNFSEEKVYTNPVLKESSLLTDMLEGVYGDNDFKHLVFMNKGGLSQEDLYAFTDIAINYGLSVNDFYFARNFVNSAKEIAVDYALDRRSDCIFIYQLDEAEDFDFLPLTKYVSGDYVYAIASP